jgi:hypothetical protein
MPHHIKHGFHQEVCGNRLAEPGFVTTHGVVQFVGDEEERHPVTPEQVHGGLAVPVTQLDVDHDQIEAAAGDQIHRFGTAGHLDDVGAA